MALSGHNLELPLDNIALVHALASPRPLPLPLVQGALFSLLKWDMSAMYYKPTHGSTGPSVLAR